MGLFALRQTGLAGDARWIWILEYANAKFKNGDEESDLLCVEPNHVEGFNTLHFQSDLLNFVSPLGYSLDCCQCLVFQA